MLVENPVEKLVESLFAPPPILNRVKTRAVRKSTPDVSAVFIRGN